MSAAADWEREAQYEFGHLTVAELDEMPRLAQAQADDLKIQREQWRVWLCRCGIEDGMPVDNQITVERLIDGRWETVATWGAQA